jgi:hypothetical protein
MYPAREFGDTCRLYWRTETLRSFLALCCEKSPARLRLPQARVSVQVAWILGARSRSPKDEAPKKATTQPLRCAIQALRSAGVKMPSLLVSI